MCLILPRAYVGTELHASFSQSDPVSAQLPVELHELLKYTFLCYQFFDICTGNRKVINFKNTLAGDTAAE
jgi:hypothetical protein